MFSDRFKFPKYFLPLSTQQGLIGPTPARWKLHANAQSGRPKDATKGREGEGGIPFVGKNDAFRIKVVEGGGGVAAEGTRIGAKIADGFLLIPKDT